ncbi:MAG: zinc-dependent metalloprotease, partial [Solirubrobacterales bacterium]|nr:zinc-dependent metalloprotease [Solirubrobacterales bacterium]
AGLIGALISGTVSELGGSGGAATLLSRLGRDPRGTLSAALKGELVQALAGPSNAALFDRLQATMAVVEGHAEWTMDTCDESGEFDGLRTALEARRDRGGPAAVVARLLGLEQKLRQYRLGRAFCLAVAERGGPEALAEVWSSPERLPSLAELEDPDGWLERIAATAPA